MERRRVAAIIRRGDRVLMVQERGTGPSGRPDGDEYWTLPGGGIDPGEDVERALVREVAEEVGLVCRSWRHAFDYPYPSGQTAVFEVEVDPGEPRLGSDDDLDCECPRVIGLTWMPIPTDASSVTGGLPITVMFFSLQP